MPPFPSTSTEMVIVQAARTPADRPSILIIETLQPGFRWAKVTKRINQFLGRGVQVVWLIDPEGRSVTVHRGCQLPQVFEGADELNGDPELPGLVCRVADLFFLPGEVPPPAPPQPV